MHKELEAFFAHHRDATAKHKTAAHEQIGHALTVNHAGQRHMMDMRAKLREAMVAPHDARVDGNLTYLRTRIRSTEDALANYLQAAETLAACYVELEDAFTIQTMNVYNLVGAPEETPALVKPAAEL